MDGKKNKKLHWFHRVWAVWVDDHEQQLVHGIPNCSEIPPPPPKTTPEIPYGKIVARPTPDGGYQLSKYCGVLLGWQPYGTVKGEITLAAAIDNLRRPVKEYSPEPAHPINGTTGVETIRDVIREMSEYCDVTGHKPTKSFFVVLQIWIAKLERLLPTKKEENNE